MSAFKNLLNAIVAWIKAAFFAVARFFGFKVPATAASRKSTVYNVASGAAIEYARSQINKSRKHGRRKHNLGGHRQHTGRRAHQVRSARAGVFA